MTEYSVKEKSSLDEIRAKYLNSTLEVERVEANGLRLSRMRFVRMEEEQGDIKFIGTITRDGDEVDGLVVIIHKEQGIIDIPKSSPRSIRLYDPNGTNAQEVIFTIKEGQI